jgi:hypothetical protein
MEHRVMTKPKAPWQVITGMIAVALVVIVLGYLEDRRVPAPVQHAMDASYGETPKPEGHGL